LFGIVLQTRSSGRIIMAKKKPIRKPPAKKSKAAKGKAKGKGKAAATGALFAHS